MPATGWMPARLDASIALKETYRIVHAQTIRLYVAVQSDEIIVTH